MQAKLRVKLLFTIDVEARFWSRWRILFTWVSKIGLNGTFTNYKTYTLVWMWSILSSDDIHDCHGARIKWSGGTVWGPTSRWRTRKETKGDSQYTVNIGNEDE